MNLFLLSIYFTFTSPSLPDTPFENGFKTRKDFLAYDENEEIMKKFDFFREEGSTKIIKAALEGKLKPAKKEKKYQVVPSLTLSSIGLTLKLRF